MSSKLLFVGKYARTSHNSKKSPKKSPIRRSKSKYEDISLGSVMKISNNLSELKSNIKDDINTNKSININTVNNKVHHHHTVISKLRTKLSNEKNRRVNYRDIKIDSQKNELKDNKTLNNKKHNNKKHHNTMKGIPK